MTPHRPAVRRWAAGWVTSCDTCHDGRHEWHWDFPDQPTAMRYAIVHAFMSRVFGSFVSPALYFDYEPGGRPDWIEMETR